MESKPKDKSGTIIVDGTNWIENTLVFNYPIYEARSKSIQLFLKSRSRWWRRLFAPENTWRAYKAMGFEVMEVRLTFVAESKPV